MKKVLLLSLLVNCFFVIYAQNPSLNMNASDRISTKRGPYFQLSIGFDGYGYLDYNVRGDITDQTPYAEDHYQITAGFTPSTEILWEVDSGLFLGAGVEYQTRRSFDNKDIGVGNFGFIPVYGVAKLSLPTLQEIHPEAIVHFGYSFLYADSKFKRGMELSSGVCWAAGASVLIKEHNNIQLFYKNESGFGAIDKAASNSKVDLTYSHISLSIGHRW